MPLWMWITLISIAFSLPVIVTSYYQLLLFISAFFYPHDLEKETPDLNEFPSVSILIACYNEKNVIAESLEAMSHLDYPLSKLQVIIADDSNDETATIVDQAALNLKNLGIDTIVSRRDVRRNFKSGAMNKALLRVTGEFTLLLDADSRVKPETLKKGVHAITTHDNTSFVSYRVGHYNRYFNRITELFALSQDMGDTLSKMGSYKLNLPFSLQGGFTLVRTSTLREIGGWSEKTITEDADLSWVLYLRGTRGIYLSNSRIMSEDPSTLETWKKQVARVQQGWTKMEIDRFWSTLKNKEASIKSKFILFLIFFAPFSNVSWIVTTFISALAVIFHIEGPSSSIFSSPIYVGILTVPTAVFYLSGLYALKVQNIMTLRNVVMIPLLSYTAACMITRAAIGFTNGIMGKRGHFFRTPKRGLNKSTEMNYYMDLRMDRNDYFEAIFSSIGLVLGLIILYYGVWILSLSLLAYSILTLKSLNFRRTTPSETDLKAEEIHDENIQNA